MSPISFLILEDEVRVARGFIRILSAEFPNAEFKTASTLEEARTILYGAARTLTGMFVDIRLPDGCGIDAIETARAFDPGIPAFVITGCAMEKDWILRLAALEVQQYDKPIPDGQLLVVLANCAIATRADQSDRLVAALDHLNLTAAETAVVSRLVRGQKVKTIADETGHSEHTIENQIASVRTKLAAHSHAEIVSRVVDAILALR